MSINPKKSAEEFLELASEQRLKIIQILVNEKPTLSKIAKKLDATASEVHRNLHRMLEAGLIEKDSSGTFSLSLYGSIVVTQISSLLFISDNKKFFKDHNFGNLQTKFIQRLGALQQRQHITGFVRVLEKWKEIHNKSQKYIYNILTEIPYSGDIIDVVVAKLKNNVDIRSVILEDVIIPDERKKVFEDKKFQNYINNGMLERKMSKDISLITLLNEKEACIIFPKFNGQSDMSEMFYSTDPLFHEWCLDYFNDCWNSSRQFQESKLK